MVSYLRWEFPEKKISLYIEKCPIFNNTAIRIIIATLEQTH